MKGECRYCDNEIYSRGLCQRCYNKVRRVLGGNFTDQEAEEILILHRPKEKTPKCIVCSNESFSMGLCRKHYYIKFKNNIDYNTEEELINKIKRIEIEQPKCDCCNEYAPINKGLCNKCYPVSVSIGSRDIEVIKNRILEIKNKKHRCKLCLVYEEFEGNYCSTCQARLRRHRERVAVGL